MSSRVQSSGGAVEGQEPGGTSPARSSSRASALEDDLSPAGAVGFEALVERAPAVLFVSAGQDLRSTVYISPQLETMLGFSASEWVTEPGSWLERVHPDDRARVEREWAAHSDRGTPLVTEYRMLTRSGEVRWVREAAWLVEEAGRPPQWQGSLLDITPEKTAVREREGVERAAEGWRLEAERLREEEARYRGLVEQIPAIVYVDLIDGPDSEAWPTIYISPQIEDILGYTPQEWMSDPLMWAAILHPDDRDAAFASDRDSFETGRESGAFEYRVLAKDGSVVWLRDESVVVRDSDGRPRFEQGLLTDVTKLKVTEARLREAEEQYRSVVESIPAALFIRAPETRALEYASPQIEALTGYPAAAWLRDQDLWIRVVHPDDLEMVLAREARSADRGEALAMDFRLVRRDGRVVWVRRESVLVGRRDGTRRFWQDFLYDLSASKKATEQLRGRDALLRTVGYAAERFLKTPSWEVVVDDVLSHLGGGVGVSRVYVFENRTDPSGALLMDKRFEWVAPGIATTMEDPENHGFPYRPDRAHYVEALGSGGVMTVTMSGANPIDEADLRSEDIRSALLVPIFAGERWWGYIGFDDCLDEREWSQTELNALKAAAGILGAAIDRERAEGAREEAEEKYRTLVEQIPAVTFIDEVPADDLTDLRPVYASPQIETLIGYSPQEWLDDTELWDKLVHPDDHEAAVAKADCAFQAGTPLSQEYRMIARDGRIVWVREEAAMVRNERGEPKFLHGVYFDITASKEAEGQLRQAEAKYRGLVERIPAITFIEEFVGGDTRDSFVSPQIETILGISPEEWYADGGLWTRSLHPDDRERVLAENARIDAAREPFSMEYRMISRDGRVVWIRDEGVLLEREGSLPAWHGVMLDITELKKAEEELARALELEREISNRLRAVDEMKNMFLTAVSHELRTPLSSILGISKTLDVADVPEPDRRELIHALVGESHRLNDLLTDLLDVDRLSRGILEPKRRPTDIERLARTVVEDMSLGGAVTIDAEPVIVPVDPPMIERIVENLLANAIRHTPPGTPVWLKVKAEDAGAVIVVEDAGPGVAGELSESIFEPFRQGPSAHPHSPGVGIGLTLVSRFAELHGGRAWVEERPGGGASFRVFLSARAPTSAG